MIPVHEQNRLEQPMGGQDDVRWTEAAAGAPPQAAATADTSPKEFIRRTRSYAVSSRLHREAAVLCFVVV